jgi:hypothetical protein
MHLYRFHARAFCQVNSVIRYLLVQRIREGQELPEESDPYRKDSQLNLRAATQSKECRWSGSKRQLCEAAEVPVGDEQTCHRAAKTLQTAIF